LSLSQLVRLDEGDGVSIVRAGERRRGGGGRHSYEVLTPPLPGLRAEVSLHTLAPGAATAGPDDPPMHEAGSRETTVVERGPVRFVCGGAAHDLEDGDSVTFDADLPHHFENPGMADARFYAIVAAGLRRS
jgi:XRE family transcriptional regulator, regulator of sulfur utilization